jgi:hypothetical protein
MITTLRQEMAPDTNPRDVVIVVESEYEKEAFERALRASDLPVLDDEEQAE